MKLICVFVFAYVKCWFSHDAAQIFWFVGRQWKVAKACSLLAVFLFRQSLSDKKKAGFRLLTSYNIVNNSWFGTVICYLALSPRRCLMIYNLKTLKSANSYRAGALYYLNIKMTRIVGGKLLELFWSASQIFSILRYL